MSNKRAPQYIIVIAVINLSCKNLDGKNLVNTWSFAKLSHYQSFPLYSTSIYNYHIVETN